MKGAIVRIHVTNFVTFHEITVLPSKYLNLITGPNGSGKSSLMCAICLGLAGKPKVAGRASNVNDYIRYNASKATIEIELLNPDGRNYVVTRTIFKDNRSSWSLGGISCPQKDVENLVSSLNIQIDNLCQFLPQDRVQDFTKMNSITLLENTEKCIGGMEMSENHNKLKQLGSSYLEKEKLLNSKKNNLANEEQIFASLQSAVDKMKSKKALIMKVERMKQKRAFLIYETSTQDLKLSKEGLQSKEAAVKGLVDLAKPVENNLVQTKNKLKAYEDNLKSVNKELTKFRSSTEEDFDLPESIEDEIKENVSDFNRMLSNEKKRVDTLKSLKVEIICLTNMLQGMDKKGMKEEEDKLAIQEKTLLKELKTIAEDKQNLDLRLMNCERQKKLVDQEYTKATNVAELKLQLMKSKGLLEPIMWFRSNLNKFQGKVYEPMAMVINMKNPKWAKYLESVVSYRDLLAFVCENPEDSNLIMSELRDKRKYRVNVITSKPNIPLSNFTRTFNLHSIQKYGFYAYLNDTFTAPEPVMRFLCKQYSVHNIPLGDSTTFTKAEEIPDKIKLYMTDDKKFTTKNSRYSDVVLSSSAQIREALLLTISVDEGKVKEYSARSSQLKEELVNLKDNYNAKESQEAELEECINKLRKDRSQLKVRINNMNNTESRLVALKRTETGEKRNECKEEDLKRDLEGANQACCMKMIDTLSKNVSHLDKFGDIIMKAKCTQLDVNKIRNDVSTIENDLQRILMQQKEAQKQERSSREIYLEAKKNTEKYLKQFEELAKVRYKSKEFQDLEKTFSEFPESREKLEREIHVTQTKAEFLGHSDCNLLQDYNRREATVTLLKKSIEQSTNDLEELVLEIESLKNKWLPLVTDYISRVNKTFGDLLSQINYVGEVNLIHGPNEYDFSNYGIKILVKFRQEGSLQELNQFRQSGGERAVAIAVYLMALQELTSVPFRCVDEINQGMDEDHEAQVFGLLSNIVSKVGGSQYFVFTPKVLRTLRFSDNVHFICVMNGELENITIDCKKIIHKRKAKERKTMAS